MSTSPGAPGASAPAENVRPATMRSPQTSGRLADTRLVESRRASPRPVSVASPRAAAASDANVVADARKSRNSGTDAGARSRAVCGSIIPIHPTRPESTIGSGRISRMLAKLKMTVLAPIARASVSTTTNEKDGWRSAVRAPYRKSCQRVRMTPSPRGARDSG